MVLVVGGGGNGCGGVSSGCSLVWFYVGLCLSEGGLIFFFFYD